MKEFTQAFDKIILELLCKRFETLAHQSLVSFL
jgi:hypothetical protein